jgi:predicted ester cyclase
MARGNLEDVVKRFLAAEDRRDYDAAVMMLDQEFVEYTPAAPQPIKGREAMRKAEEQGNKPYFDAFPDVQRKILSMMTKGDMVAVELMYTGTFKRPLETPKGTIAPTGRRCELRYAEFYRVTSEGLIAEAHVYIDTAGFFQQLGLKT